MAPSLRVRTESLYPYYLASTQIDIPDPERNCFYGQQVIAFYRYPKACLGEKTIALTIRYMNKEWDYLTFPLDHKRGYFIFRLLKENYYEKGGLLAYKVDLLHNNTVIKTWKHHLYVELINPCPCPCPK